MHGHGHMQGLAVQQAVFLDAFDADGIHLHGAEAHVDVLFPVGQVAGQGVVVAADLLMAGGRRDVVVAEVIAQHAVRAVLGDEGLHGLADAQQPVVGPVVRIALEVQRDHLVFQQGIQGGRIVIVALFGAQAAFGHQGADGPAVGAVVAFAPPAVGHAEIEAAVDRHFLAAGAASLVGAAGIVEPDIAALHHQAGDRQAVIFDEEDLAEEAGRQHVLEEFPDQADALAIGRMGLAGKDEYDGLAALFQDTGQTVHIGKEQGRTFVRRKAAGKADHQSLGGQPGCHLLLLFVGDGEFFEELRQAGADGFQQVLFLGLASRPEVGIGDVRDAGPFLVVGRQFLPAFAQVLLQQRTHGRTGVGGYMDAVGHGENGDLRHRDPLPAFLPHMAGDHTVQGADAVGLHGILEGQDGHLEDVALAAFEAAHIDQGLPADAHGLDVGLEIGLHAFQREALIAGIHGRMGREQGAAAHHFARLFEGQAILLHEQADAFEDEEGRMTFVHVIGGGADV